MLFGRGPGFDPQWDYKTLLSIFLLLPISFSEEEEDDDDVVEMDMRLLAVISCFWHSDMHCAGWGSLAGMREVQEV